MAIAAAAADRERLLGGDGAEPTGAATLGDGCVRRPPLCCMAVRAGHFHVHIDPHKYRCVSEPAKPASQRCLTHNGCVCCCVVLCAQSDERRRVSAIQPAVLDTALAGAQRAADSREHDHHSGPGPDVPGACVCACGACGVWCLRMVDASSRRRWRSTAARSTRRR